MFGIPAALPLLLELVSVTPSVLSISLFLSISPACRLSPLTNWICFSFLCFRTIPSHCPELRISYQNFHFLSSQCWFQQGIQRKTFHSSAVKKKALDSESGSKGSHPAPAVSWVTWCKWFSNSGQLVWKQGNWSKTGFLTYWHYWFLGLISLCC